ncbi:MAG: MATE family efflux transporter [Candidatus Thermoplasmatota archaeon]|nr:MATE family efflux transporter [Candidatus Thermoplasmatota archaeon]
MSEGGSKGVKTLLGDPKKAIIKLSVPMIIAMSLQTVYNIADAFWVGGLGSDALASVGFFFPFFFLTIAVGAGIGMGGGSAISRRIGARDRKGADNVAVHTMLLMIAAAVVLSLISIPLARPLFMLMGSGKVTGLSLQYAYPLFITIIFVFFNNVAGAILRAEGDAKRAMYPMLIGAVLNIILDPLFIYGFGLGVFGASVATVVSMVVSSLPLFYWLFFRKDTYVRIDGRDFRPDLSIIKDIFTVGIPSTLMQMSMAVNMFLLVGITSRVGGTDGVAVLSTGWRVVTLATMPLIGIATAVMSVTGAAFGARSYVKLRDSFMYSVKMSFFLELAIAVSTFVLAYPIAFAFTRTENAANIRGDLTSFLMIICFFYPAVAFGMLSSAMFQGAGKGSSSLLITVLRTIVLMPPSAILFSVLLGLDGIWVGMVVANVIGAAISFTWARISISRIGKAWGGENGVLSDRSFKTVT